uniref:ATP-grasp domain-containing protein n=1 Tax=Candidatus Kentrum sp. UNK TaxID=2126344 RepID=A0A451AWI4_9GAMM|nr:MAG: ATP-grasp domain-containing protein [Candidatus Kentron sp. UNK]VFK70409.1 MAG: ATP-grasp domain-containing protein [Candidatus Kentron sp. UNK]
MNYIITGGNFTSHLLQELDGDFPIEILTEQELQESDISFHKEDKLFLPSQSSLDPVMERMDCPERLHAIEQLTDKYRCRSLMRSLFPDFEFRELELSDMRKEMFSPERKYVIKPSKGFFGIGVRTLEKPGDIHAIKEEIRRDLEVNRGFFSDRIFSGERMIVEQFIEGDEYAIDMFYSEQGKPIIVNLAYHPLPKRREYDHVLYYTNNRIFQEIYQQAESFFTCLNAILGVTSLPIHAEFRLEKGELVPIELNPFRYGGFGMADLSYWSFRQCPYLSFFHDDPYDWESLWDEQRRKRHYAWILAYKGVGVNVDGIVIKDIYAKLRRFIGDSALLHYQGLDYRTNPVFAIAYLAEEKEHRLWKWLDVEFRDFFV